MHFLYGLTIPPLSINHKVMNSFAHKPCHQCSASFIKIKNSSFTSNGQNLETIYMSFREQRVKQTLVYPSDGILLSNEKEQIIDSYNSLMAFKHDKLSEKPI